MGVGSHTKTVTLQLLLYPVYTSSRGVKTTRTGPSPDSVVLLAQFILVFWPTGPGPLIIVFIVEKS